MREESICTEPDVVMCSAASREPIRTMLGELALALRKHLEDPSEEVARCTPCLGKSDNKHLEKFCPGSPFEPFFSPVVVACSSAARSGKPCPPLDLRPCCMIPERPF